MPSDLTPHKEIPLWAAPVPRTAPTSPHHTHGPSHRRRLPPVFKLTLTLLGGLALLAWWSGGLSSGSWVPLRGGEFAGLQEGRSSGDSHYDVVKAFFDRRLGHAAHGALDEHLRQQQKLGLLVGSFQPLHAPAREQLGIDVAHGETRASASSHAGTSTPDKTGSIGLFMMWPKHVEYSSTSSFLLQSFFSSPSSDAANLVILIRGDAATCRDQSRLIEHDKQAVLEVTMSLDRNVEVVCFDDDEYWAHHRDYLCALWNCSESDQETLLQAMMAADEDDEEDDQFRLLRGLVFDRLLPADAAWWGWIGADVYLGNLQRTFPWDVAAAFDVVIPNGVRLDEPTPVALSAELAFFQRRRATTDVLDRYPAFRSLEAFLDTERPTISDFSDYLLTGNQATFLAYEGHLLPFTSSSLARTVTQTGVFSLVLPPPTPSADSPALSVDDRRAYLRLMTQPSVAAHVLGSFTASGVERAVAGDATMYIPPLLQAGDDAQGSRTREATYWVVRETSGKDAIVRSEPRRGHLPSVLSEWSFDIARDHQTNYPQPPPYPPNRLRKGHALAFLPEQRSTSSSAVSRHEHIWDDVGSGAERGWWEKDSGGRPN